MAEEIINTILDVLLNKYKDCNYKLNKKPNIMENYSDLEWLDIETEKPTEEEIEEEIKRLDSEWNTLQYQRIRARQFPEIKDQLDMQYWDQVNGTTTWKDALAKVKADNPKGDE